jgi:hypothetical protein
LTQRQFHPRALPRTPDRGRSNGIALLEQQAGGDFTSVTKRRQDQILSQSQVASLTSLLFGHTIEAMYAVPEYGGST